DEARLRRRRLGQYAHYSRQSRRKEPELANTPREGMFMIHLNPGPYQDSAVRPSLRSPLLFAIGMATALAALAACSGEAPAVASEDSGGGGKRSAITTAGSGGSVSASTASAGSTSSASNSGASTSAGISSSTSAGTGGTGSMCEYPAGPYGTNEMDIL